MKTFHYNGNLTYLCKVCRVTIEYSFTDGRWRDFTGSAFGQDHRKNGRLAGMHKHMPEGGENF